MNGRDLTLGALAGLAVAGMVAQRRRGSRDEEVITLSRGVLRIPGEAPIRVKKLGAGAFATAYVTVEASPPVVYVVTPDDVYDKELLAMAREAEPSNPHLPKVERVGEMRDQFVYRMPLYRTPLKKADSPTGWKDYTVLKKCREDAYEHWDARRRSGKRGYQINEQTYDCAERSGVSPSTLEAIRILIDTAANYGDEVVFEFSPRNLGTDDAGTFVLLDPMYDREKLQTKRQEERRKREAMERSRFGMRW